MPEKEIYGVPFYKETIPLMTWLLWSSLTLITFLLLQSFNIWTIKASSYEIWGDPVQCTAVSFLEIIYFLVVVLCVYVTVKTEYLLQELEQQDYSTQKPNSKWIPLTKYTKRWLAKSFFMFITTKLTLPFFLPCYKVPCDYIGPNWNIEETPILKSPD